MHRNRARFACLAWYFVRFPQHMVGESMMNRSLGSIGVVAVAVLCLAGCGGPKPPSKATQEEKLKETEASMDKGMDAMKGMKDIKR
jgi:hypothetical protein